MGDRGSVNGSGAGRSGTPLPTWWLVFLRESSELWIGGKVLTLLFLYGVLLGIASYVLATNRELSLLPPKEMVYETVQAAVGVAIFIGLIVGADSLSGERERATLEGLLLTPASRRQILVGKFLAAVSPWPAAFAISVPYLRLLSQGEEVFGPAVLWCAVVGTALTPGFTALGMLVSFWCSSNRTSMFVSLGLYLFFLLPTQLSPHAQAGAVGEMVQWLNPMAAPRVFLAKILVNNRSLGEVWTWLAAPVVFALLVFVLLFWYAGPGLRLEAGRGGRRPSPWSRAMGLSMIACLVACLEAPPTRAQEAGATSGQPPRLGVSIDMDYKVVKAGDAIRYRTVVTNHGSEPTPPLIVAMNIINLKGYSHKERYKPGEAADPVDPEDWSPQRTQYSESLPPGQSTTHSWRVNAILDGNYMVYMVVIPKPDRPEDTSQVVASSGIHLTVKPFTKLNPGGVLPYAIGGPALLGVVIFLLYWRRRRRIDTGDSPESS